MFCPRKEAGRIYMFVSTQHGGCEHTQPRDVRLLLVIINMPAVHVHVRVYVRCYDRLMVYHKGLKKKKKTCTQPMCHLRLAS